MDEWLRVEDAGLVANLFGVLGSNTESLEKQFKVSIEPSADGLRISGDNPENIDKAKKVLKKMLDLGRRGMALSPQTGQYLSLEIRNGHERIVDNYEGDLIGTTAKGRPIRAKTDGQARYVKAIDRHDVTFCIGPAGTGKTYLAVALAVNSFRANKVNRIILTRPAVEAGENLGYLPGDLQMKLDPYMRPLYDALQDLMGAEQYLKLMERGLIEVSPLAYMRGRTLDDSFIILDEAQNTTPEQMKMFLTRIGYGSKVVVTGDVTQIDLPSARASGLLSARRILRDVEGLTFVELAAEDVVRNPMVQRIILAYEADEARREAKRDAHRSDDHPARRQDAKGRDDQKDRSRKQGKKQKS